MSDLADSTEPIVLVDKVCKEYRRDEIVVAFVFV